MNYYFCLIKQMSLFTRAQSQYKDGLSRHGYFLYKDKAAKRSFYFHNGINYTGKIQSSDRDCPQKSNNIVITLNDIMLHCNLELMGFSQDLKQKQ